MISPTDPAKVVSSRWISLLDLTRLEGRDGDDAAVAALCGKAKTHHGNVAAVCIYPRYIALARSALQDTNIAVATVVNFPSGEEPLAQVLEDLDRALDDGASEIDIVVPYKAWLRGDTHAIAALLDPVAEQCAGRAIIKAILETGLISESADRKALAYACARPGVAFLKTSTGKAAVGATQEAVRDLVYVVADLHTAGHALGLKIAGGVRTLDELNHYHNLIVPVLGARFLAPTTLRIGASTLLDALLVESADV